MARVENGPGTLVLGAADRAIAIAAVKARLRVASADEDALIAAFAETALGLAERVMGQVSIARTMTQAVTGSGGWQGLGARPVRAITAVTDPAGVALAVADYAVDVDDDGLGRVRLPAGTRARVSFSAGVAADWPSLPTGVREGAALLAAHLFDDRTGTLPVPAAVTALWRPLRSLRLLPDTRLADTGLAGA